MTWRSSMACWALLGLGPLAFCPSASAQYSIDWFKIAGGGGASAGGDFSLTGTIGQPDAGVMSGGSYGLAGGFWSVVAAVQTPGAPLLAVTRTATNSVVVSWPLPEAGWQLHWTASLSTTPVVWTEVGSRYATNDQSIYFIDAAPAGNRFYRLHKP